MTHKFVAKKKKKKRKKLVKLKEDNNKPKQINIQSKIIFNQEFDVNDQLVPFYQKIYKKQTENM